MKKILLTALFLVLFSRYSFSDEPSVKPVETGKFEKATFAGGCFWCMEKPFEQVPGVKDVVSGFTGGFKENPTYHEVSSGTTGHCESIDVTYDPREVSYEQLLDVFWHNIDPTDPDGSFNDRGKQYR